MFERKNISSGLRVFEKFHCCFIISFTFFLPMREASHHLRFITTTDELAQKKEPKIMSTEKKTDAKKLHRKKYMMKTTKNSKSTTCDTSETIHYNMKEKAEN